MGDEVKEETRATSCITLSELERALIFNMIGMVRQPLKRFEQRVTLSYFRYI